MGYHALVQGIFQTQGSNPSLPHCKQILYHLSHQGSPRILEWVAYPFSRGFSQPRNTTGISCISGRFFTSWATRGDQGSVSGLGRSPGEGNGYPFQYSSLKNSMDRRTWWLQAMGLKKVGHNWVINVLRIHGLIDAFLPLYCFSLLLMWNIWGSSWKQIARIEGLHIPKHQHICRQQVWAECYYYRDQVFQSLVLSQSLPLEKEMATLSSVLAWRIPGKGEPGGLPSMGSHRVGHDWSDLAAAVPASDLVSEPDSVLSLISFADEKIGLLPFNKAVRDWGQRPLWGALKITYGLRRWCDFSPSRDYLSYSSYYRLSSPRMPPSVPSPGM